MKKSEPEFTELEDIELRLLLEAIYLKYGYDFRDYNWSSVKRQMLRRRSLSELSSFLEMQKKVLYEPQFFSVLFNDLSIDFSEMFRDPSFYRAFREHVIPVLRTYPVIKIWHAGCATAEEVYSMAILLKEENLYDHTHIYATDFNNQILQKAKEGIYSARHIQKYTANYQESGGKGVFDKYYTTVHNSMIMDPSLRSNIVFTNHNLTSDESFNEMHVIFCRNVLVYFNERLQYRVLRLFYSSLCQQGFLCLGSQEHIRFSLYADFFDDVVREERIYKRKVKAWNMPR